MNAHTTVLRQLSWASRVEGTTLVLLLFLAVPLKRLAGMPEWVSVLGPLHGVAFLLYVTLVLRGNTAGALSNQEMLLFLVASFVPFGAFLLAGKLRRKAAILAPAATEAKSPN